MPIPFILGGIAVAAGLVGAKKAKDASDKNARAKRINRRADEKFENAKKALLAARDEAGRALEDSRGNTVPPQSFIDPRWGGLSQARPLGPQCPLRA